MKRNIFCIFLLVILFICSHVYAEADVDIEELSKYTLESPHNGTVVLAASKSAKKKLNKKGKRKRAKKKSNNRGGVVFFENPYGDSSEWATIDLYSKTNLKGEHWLIEIYGSSLTIKDSKGNVQKKVKDDFFRSAKIALSTAGGVYFYDSDDFNMKKDGSYGWTFLPSNNPIIEIKDFDKAKTSKNIADPYYKIVKSAKKKKLGGHISSIVIKFSKLR